MATIYKYSALHCELLGDLLVEQLLHDASIASVNRSEERYCSILKNVVTCDEKSLQMNYHL